MNFTYSSLLIFLYFLLEYQTFPFIIDIFNSENINVKLYFLFLHFYFIYFFYQDLLLSIKFLLRSLKKIILNFAVSLYFKYSSKINSLYQIEIIDEDIILISNDDNFILVDYSCDNYEYINDYSEIVYKDKVIYTGMPYKNVKMPMNGMIRKASDIW